MGDAQIALRGELGDARVRVTQVGPAGERAYTMARAFNAREGLTAVDDHLPARFFEPFREGPSTGNALPPEDFERARVMFYQMMGWDEQTGAPAPWKLHELGVGWIADQLCR